MVRYVRQPFNYSCGPTAIINVIKWLGQRISIKRDHTRIARACQATHDMGVEEPSFERCLKRMVRKTASVRKRKSPSVKAITKYMNESSDHSIVLLYYRPVSHPQLERMGHHIEGHYVFITRLCSDGVELVNERSNETMSLISWDMFKTKLRFRRQARILYPTAWFIRKK